MVDQNLQFASGLQRNAKLVTLAAEYVHKPPSRPPAESYEYYVELGKYQVESRKHVQLLIPVVVDRLAAVSGQLTLMLHYIFPVPHWDHSQRTAWQLLKIASEKLSKTDWAN